jgi:hypothetical protein
MREENLILYTVTSHDVIFCYAADSIRTYRRKKILACGPEFFLLIFFATGIFRRCNGKYLSTVWAQTFDLQVMKRYSTIAPLHPCLYNAMAFIVFLPGIFRPFL